MRFWRGFIRFGRLVVPLVCVLFGGVFTLFLPFTLGFSGYCRLRTGIQYMHYVVDGCGWYVVDFPFFVWCCGAAVVSRALVVVTVGFFWVLGWPIQLNYSS